MTGGVDTRPRARHRSLGNPLTERYIRLYGSAIALAYGIALVIRLLCHRWISHAAARPCVDFIWIWLSAKLALSRHLVAAYDYSLLSAARTSLSGPPNCLLEHFDYPPTFLLFTAPLGLLPYPVAFTLWLAATLLVYLAAVYMVLPRPAAVVAALTPFPVLFNVLLGHNGFLTAGLIGLALAALERRPLLAGASIGLLTFKPQLGILFPLALLAGRRWRALAAAAATSILFAAAAGIAFGWDAWPAFIGALGDRARTLNDIPALNVALVSVFGVLRQLGIGAAVAWSVQSAVTAAVALTVAVLWLRPIPHALQAAALVFGSFLASPHAHGYDACMLAIGAAFLVQDGLQRGFLPRERGTMLGGWTALLLLTGPVPAIVGAVLLVLVLRRVRQLPQQAAAAPPANLRAVEVGS